MDKPLGYNKNDFIVIVESKSDRQTFYEKQLETIENKAIQDIKNLLTDLTTKLFPKGLPTDQYNICAYDSTGINRHVKVGAILVKSKNHDAQGDCFDLLLLEEGLYRFYAHNQTPCGSLWNGRYYVKEDYLKFGLYVVDALEKAAKSIKTPG